MAVLTLVMTVLTLVFATLGFLSPSNRGALLSSVLVFFVLMGLPAGYTSARLAKFFKDENPYRTALLTGTLFPGVCFAVFFWVNIVEAVIFGRTLRDPRRAL
ncbi:hypothetical protein T484DRAFT_1870377 [Baffinella frigidus]|nr:hypothetical protein T484DRAFT_1870377 [Cryptophyta sp. CCMP2293]